MDSKPDEELPFRYAVLCLSRCQRLCLTGASSGMGNARRPGCSARRASRPPAEQIQRDCIHLYGTTLKTSNLDHIDIDDVVVADTYIKYGLQKH